MADMVRVELIDEKSAAAVAARCAAAAGKAALPAHARAKILIKASEALEAQAEDFARLICAEVGKPIAMPGAPARPASGNPRSTPAARC